MSGIPVVVVESGGLPVVSVAADAAPFNALPATVATNGYGLAITLVEDDAPVVARGVPMIIEGLA
jgi:hypothetical protein